MIKPNPIFLSSWSVIDLTKSELLNLEMLPGIAEKHGFQGIELVDRQLPGLSVSNKQRIIKLFGNSALNTTFALTTDFSNLQNGAREQQINYVLEMLDFANELDAQSVRILLGGTDLFLQKWLKKITRPKKEISTLETIKKQKQLTSKLQGTKFFTWLHKVLIKNRKPKPLTDQNIRKNIYSIFDNILPKAEELKINLAIENHWGVSGFTDNILDIINFYQSPFLGTCPDFGNFTVFQDKYFELKRLLPFAKEVHAKSYQFNEDGEETTIQYETCVNLIRHSKYQGPLVVEYEGAGDKMMNSVKTKDLVIKYL